MAPHAGYDFLIRRIRAVRLTPFEFLTSENEPLDAAC
jgi:hypothetical protein